MFTFAIKSTIERYFDYSDKVSIGDIIYQGGLYKSDGTEIFNTAEEAEKSGKDALGRIVGGRAFSAARNCADIEAVEVNFYVIHANGQLQWTGFYTSEKAAFLDFDKCVGLQESEALESVDAEADTDWADFLGFDLYEIENPRTIQQWLHFDEHDYAWGDGNYPATSYEGSVKDMKCVLEDPERADDINLVEAFLVTKEGLSSYSGFYAHYCNQEAYKKGLESIVAEIKDREINIPEFLSDPKNCLSSGMMINP